MDLLSVETYRCESKQLLGGYGSVAHPRVASLLWFVRCDGRDRMVDCIRVPGLGSCPREESGTCCFLDMSRARAKKSFQNSAGFHARYPEFLEVCMPAKTSMKPPSLEHRRHMHRSKCVANSITSSARASSVDGATKTHFTFVWTSGTRPATASLS